MQDKEEVVYEKKAPAIKIIVLPQIKGLDPVTKIARLKTGLYAWFRPEHKGGPITFAPQKEAGHFLIIWSN